EMMKYTERKISVANRSLERFENWNLDINQYQLDKIKPILNEFDIIINTTPVGMNESSDELIIPIEEIHANDLLCDIIYIPYKSHLIKPTEISVLTIDNGLAIVIYIGADSFKIWTSELSDIKAMKNKIIEQLKSR